jgi:hypothetical protein
MGQVQDGHIIYPQALGIKHNRDAAYDRITEAHICNAIGEEFGRRYTNGSAAFDQVNEDGKTFIVCYEKAFRSLLKDRDIHNAVEIGTYLGVSSLFLAHYAYHLTTIDVIPRTEPVSLWNYFGVSPKITYAVALDNKAKQEYLSGLDFDFAFIDGDHSYEGVKFDFELVERGGRVLFHDYPGKEGVKKFVDELPKKELEIVKNFAYWEKG